MHNALPKRKDMRLRGYDYSTAGGYFLTICTKDRAQTLSRIRMGADALTAPQIELTELGKLVRTHLERFPGIEKYVVMPNHVHLLSIRESAYGAGVAQDVRAFKSLVSKAAGYSVWQRGYYDHILRGEEDYLIHWQYIDENPAKWCDDPYFTER